MNCKKLFPRLSIIVPCHNSEKYIEQCIDSIINQEFSDFEVIIVDDGSSDGSLSLILAKSLLDKRIVVIKNDLPSGSAGIPRNQALNVAKGELIGFVDSDDWIGPSYFKILIDTLDANNADLVISNGFINHYDGVVKERFYPKNWCIKNIKKKNKISCTHMSSMIWDKVYKRSLLVKNNILLGSYPAAVDIPFIFKAYYYCVAPAVAKTHQYNYRRESENSVTVKFRRGTLCDFEIKAYKEIFGWSKRNNISNAYKAYMFLKRLASFTYACKLVKLNYFISFFMQCRMILKEPKSRISDEIFSISGGEYLKPIYKLFLDNKPLEFIVTQRSSDSQFLFTNKKSGKIEIPKTISLSSHLKSTCKRNLIFFPDWSESNPYQSLFYNNLQKNEEYTHFNVLGIGPEKVDLSNLLQLVGQGGIIHIHWVHPFIQDKASTKKFGETLKTLKSQKSSLIIWTIHNIVSHECSNREDELKRLRYIASYCDCFIVHSNNALEDVVHLYNLNRESIHVVPHGKYNIDKEKTIRLINSYKIAKKRMRLTILGNIRKYKNVEWAAKFICILNQSLPANQFIELRIAGKIGLELGLEYSKKQTDLLNNLSKNHDFISLKLQRLSDDELFQEFCDADFVFIPYTEILTSGICINAISHGRPFIAPKFPSLIELHRDGHSYLYETEDALRNKLLEYNSYYHRGLLGNLFDPNKIISETSFLEWSNIFSNLSRDPFSV